MGLRSSSDKMYGVVIRSGWEVFSRLVRFEVENGSKIGIQQDVWCGDQPLKASFPTLPNIARFKDASMADLILSLNDIVQWNIIYIKPVHD